MGGSWAWYWSSNLVLYWHWGCESLYFEAYCILLGWMCMVVGGVDVCTSEDVQRWGGKWFSYIFLYTKHNAVSIRSLGRSLRFCQRWYCLPSRVCFFDFVSLTPINGVMLLGIVMGGLSGLCLGCLNSVTAPNTLPAVFICGLTESRIHCCYGLSRETWCLDWCAWVDRLVTCLRWQLFSPLPLCSIIVTSISKYASVLWFSDNLRDLLLCGKLRS